MSESESSANESLHKSLGVIGVFAVTIGTTLSSGFFLLPGLTYEKAGPAMVLSYILASVAVLPALFSVVELCTAMPKAGGAYYFLDRSMGPAVGTVGGFGTWLALVLKTSFALVGMGAYIALYTQAVPMQVSAIGLALLFGILNLRGGEGASRLQVFLSVGLLTILLWFLSGVFHIQPTHFKHTFDHGWHGILIAAGMITVSFGSLTKIASIAEEVKNPEKNLPRGVLAGILTSMVIYVIGTTVMVGIIPGDVLNHCYTPVAEAASRMAGDWGKLLVTVAALLSFASVANAGILAASRYPMAMSRDGLLPQILGKISKRGIPIPGVLLTTGAIIAVLLIFGQDAAKIAKLASSFILLVFALMALCVIIMRESHIQSYDPSFKSPWYPWMQVAGIVIPIFLIGEMGFLAQVFTEAVILLGGIWFFEDASHTVKRDGAIFHIFERLGQRRYEALDSELRGIMKEKGLRAEDPFDDIVARAQILDFPDPINFEEAAQQASEMLARRMEESPDHLFEGFMRGTQTGATPVAKGAALPHLRVPGLPHPEMILARTPGGIAIETVNDFGDTLEEGGKIQAVFFLVSPEADPGQHLRILAQIAMKVDDASFMPSYLSALNEQEVKECLLRDERYYSLNISENNPRIQPLLGSELRSIPWPEGCLVALIRRGQFTFVPRGATKLHPGDRITIIGDPEGIETLHQQYAPDDDRDATIQIV